MDDGKCGVSTLCHTRHRFQNSRTHHTVHGLSMHFPQPVENAVDNYSAFHRHRIDDTLNTCNHAFVCVGGDCRCGKSAGVELKSGMKPLPWVSAFGQPRLAGGFGLGFQCHHFLGHCLPRGVDRLQVVEQLLMLLSGAHGAHAVGIE